jgi:hypothetical protein
MSAATDKLKWLWTHEAALVTSVLAILVGVLAKNFSWWNITADQLFTFGALVLGVGVTTRQAVYSRASHEKALRRAVADATFPDLPVDSVPEGFPAPPQPGMPSNPAGSHQETQHLF